MEQCSKHWSHPHLCGEYPAISSRPETSMGATPTYAGNTYQITNLNSLIKEPPPLVRGIQDNYLPAPHPFQSHPHLCGEYVFGRKIIMQDQGATPTYAGNTSWCFPASPQTRSHPHLCGEYPPILPGLAVH